MNKNKNLNNEEKSSDKLNHKYDLLNIPNFNEEDYHRFDDLTSYYPYFDPHKDIVLYPYLSLMRMAKPKNPNPYDGKRCIVAECKGNESPEHHEHMLHIYLAITQFLRTSYNLDRVPDVLSVYIQGVLTVLTELLAPTSSTFHKEQIDMEIVKNTLEKLSKQVPQLSEWMTTNGKVSYRAKHDDSKIEHIKSQEHLDNLLQESALVMIDFWADWCGPCHTLNPILTDLSHEMSDKIKIVKVNVDEQRELSKKFKIESMPTMVLYHKDFKTNHMETDGVLERIIGVKDKEFLKQRIEFAHKDGFTKEHPSKN